MHTILPEVEPKTHPALNKVSENKTHGMDIDQPSSHLHRHNLIHPDLYHINQSASPIKRKGGVELTGTAASTINALAPATNLNAIKTPI